MSLQTIAYGNSGPEDLDDFITTEIFPESDLPKLAEIAEAVDRLFEIVVLQNDRHHYVTTLKNWLANLKENRDEAVAVVGEKVVVRFERYLRLSAYIFEIGSCDLYRISFRRIDKPRNKH
jgi:cyclopropane-fatty-acyl-phospholipid synthase